MIRGKPKSDGKRQDGRSPNMTNGLSRNNNKVSKSFDESNDLQNQVSQFMDSNNDQMEVCVQCSLRPNKLMLFLLSLLKKIGSVGPKKKKPLFPVALPTLIFWCRP